MASYTDYPQAATNNAKKALKFREETENKNDCGTPVGWARANQLANREPISEDTIKRMASFNRHRQNKDVPYEEGCGGLMWDAWGGTEGIDWAIRKSEQIDKEKQNMFEIDIIGDIEGFWGMDYDKISNRLKEADGAPVLINLHSGGGSVLEGFAIRNALQNYKAEKTIKVIGLAASIASLILTGADRVEVQKGSFVMIHNVALWNAEPMTAEELQQQGRTLETMETEIIEAYTDAAEKRNKLINGNRKETADNFKKLMDAETWLNAQQAIDLGLADSIVSGYDKEEEEEKEQTQPATPTLTNKFKNTLSNYKNIPDNLKLLYNIDKMENQEEKVSISTLEKILNAFSGLFGAKNQTEQAPQLEPEQVAEETEQTEEQKQNLEMTEKEMIEHLSGKGYTVTNQVEEAPQVEETQEENELLTEVQALKNQIAEIKASLGKPTGDKVSNDGKKVDPLAALIKKNLK